VQHTRRVRECPAQPAGGTITTSENNAKASPKTAIKIVSKQVSALDTCLVSPAAPYLAPGADTHLGTAGAPYLLSPPAPKLMSSAHTQRIATRYAACRHPTPGVCALHSS
jgi:hypothetical protein